MQRQPKEKPEQWSPADSLCPTRNLVVVEIVKELGSRGRFANEQMFKAAPSHDTRTSNPLPELRLRLGTRVQGGPIWGVEMRHDYWVLALQG